MGIIVDQVALRGGARGDCAGAFMLYQRHGDTVRVPAGWPHTVRNLARCVKFAADGCAPADLPAAVEASLSVRSQYFAQGRGQEDFGNLCGRVWEGLRMYVTAA